MKVSGLGFIAIAAILSVAAAVACSDTATADPTAVDAGGDATTDAIAPVNDATVGDAAADADDGGGQCSLCVDAYQDGPSGTFCSPADQAAYQGIFDCTCQKCPTECSATCKNFDLPDSTCQACQEKNCKAPLTACYAGIETRSCSEIEKGVRKEVPYANGANGYPSSFYLILDIRGCMCDKTNCFTECSDYCTGAGPRTDACISCYEGKCPAETAACRADLPPGDGGTDAGDAGDGG
jgi:hypothetical protein